MTSEILWDSVAPPPGHHIWSRAYELDRSDLLAHLRETTWLYEAATRMRRERPVPPPSAALPAAMGARRHVARGREGTAAASIAEGSPPETW